MHLMLPIVALIAQSDPVVRTREPSPPVSQSQSFLARCGASEIAIRDFGLSRPSAPASITVNGAPATGDLAAARGFLAVPDAAYRFSVQCAPGGDALVRGYRLQRGTGNAPAVAVLSVTLRGAAVTDARVEERVEADAFFFR
jgi:hypothetical protein